MLLLHLLILKIDSFDSITTFPTFAVLLRFIYSFMIRIKEYIKRNKTANVGNVVIESKLSIFKISKCSKLAQKDFKTRHDWVSKVINWVLCKKLKYDYTNKWYMHNPTSVLENETHKLLWDFDIQTDDLISARRPDLIATTTTTTTTTKKRTCQIVDFAVPADHRVKLKESKKKEIYVYIVRELKRNRGTWKWPLYLF